MPNIRVASDNAIDRSTLTASTEASVSMTVGNLLTDKKSKVWRSAAGTSATLTATWASLEAVSFVALPFCNLSPTATIRVRGYSDAAGTTQVFDTGAVASCPETAVKLRGWTSAQSASAYSFGGGAFARVWFAQNNVCRLMVDISDANNLQGYIEASRLVAGPYWSAAYNPSAVSFSFNDTTTVSRNEAGDQVCDAGTVYKSLSIDMSMLPTQDRAPLVSLVRASKAYPILVAVFPENGDAGLERDTLIYGRRTKDTDISIQYAFAYTSKLEVESI